MANILKLLGFLAGVIPIILNLIKEFEVPGFGPEKKKTILDSVALFYNTVNNIFPLPITKEKLLSVAGNFIDIAVAFFNLVGVFKHKTENPTQAIQGIVGQRKKLFPIGKNFLKLQEYTMKIIIRNIERSYMKNATAHI